MCKLVSICGPLFSPFSAKFLHPLDMSSMLTSSQGLVLATAMAVSAGTLLLFDLFRDKSFPPTSQIPRNQDSNPDDQKQTLKSCLSSGKKKEKKQLIIFSVFLNFGLVLELILCEQVARKGRKKRRTGRRRRRREFNLQMM